jgi:hypothetical protein
MRDINLFLLVIGGFSLGGLMVAIYKDHREQPRRRWEYALLVTLAFIVIYGIEHMPNLGG